ncbi:hypothetical protein D3C80_1196390 [compost metagenome]
MRQSLALEAQRGQRVTLALGDGGAQRPVISALVRGSVPVAACCIGVACIQRAAGSGDAGIIGKGAVWQAAPDRLGGFGVAGRFECVGQR